MWYVYIYMKLNELVVQSCPTLCNPMNCSPQFFCPWNSPGKDTGVGGHSLLQGIFPTQKLNLGHLHCRQILYHWVTREAHTYVCVYIHTYISVHTYIHIFIQWNSIVQSPSHVQLFMTPWTAACQAFLSLTISRSLPKFMFIALMMPSSHLILWCPLLLLPSVFPSIRDFSSDSSVHIRWPKYWSFSFSISPSSVYSGFISLKIVTGLIFKLSKGLSGVFSSTTVRRH